MAYGVFYTAIIYKIKNIHSSNFLLEWMFFFYMTPTGFEPVLPP